jgi:ubiquinone/menaquinone biosynthesis C-methylase UbiE
MLSQTTHNQSIIDQFTKQALPFSQKSALTDESAFKLMMETCGLMPADKVLDVACGPGLTACAFAALAAHVTGIDLTPAMIERARVRQAKLGLTNLTWQVGDVTSLPYNDAAFSLVMTRYSFHHFLAPRVVLAEMKRVCQPGGRVMVIDAAPARDKAEAYNRFEKLRDPSHTRALPPEELSALLSEAGLVEIKAAFYQVEFELEKALSASFPNTGDEERLRQIIQADIGKDSLGMGARRRANEIYFSYPTMILVGTKPEEKQSR